MSRPATGFLPRDQTSCRLPAGSGAMQTEAAGRRRQAGRDRRGESGHSRAEPRGNQPGARSSEEQVARLKEIIVTMQQKERGGGEEEQRGRWRDRSRRAASAGGEGGEQEERLRRRVHQLEKEKLELTSGHNQELCRLQAQLTRLRSSVERGEAQREELQLQLTVSQRDTERAAELSRDRSVLTERAAQLQQTVEELQGALDITRRAREEDQLALQQEVEERDGLMHNFSSENQRLHRLLQDQEEALQESERRIGEVQKEREKEAELKRRLDNDLKYLMEREERSRREKELLDQRLKSLQSNMEAERAAHLETRFSSEVIQLRGRDLEAALAAERSGLQEAQRSLEVLTARLREEERSCSLERERSSSTERALQRLQTELEQCRCDLSAERTMTSDLTERLEEERRRHADTHTRLQQEAQRRSDAEERLTHISEALQQHTHTPAAEHAGKRSPSEALQLLEEALSSCTLTQEAAHTRLQELQDQIQTLQRVRSDQSRQVQEELTRLQKESCDWSTQSRSLQEELQREREEREREKEEREREKEREKEEREREKEEREREKQEREREREREKEEREREKEEREREKQEREREREREKEEKEREKEESEREKEREKEEMKSEVQRITEHHQEESEARLSFLYCVYQRLLAGCVLLHQPQSMLGNFTWKELCDVITEQVDQVTSDLQKANDKVVQLQGVCEKKSVCVRELQRSQECVLSRLEESVRRREEAWSSRHTHTVTQLQKELQVCRSQCDSLRERASSLELRASSLSSELCRVRGLLSSSRREARCFLAACALLGGTLTHTQRRLQTLCRQKELLCSRLRRREELEEQVRRLAAALGAEEDEEEQKRRRRSAALRRWRSGVCVVLAVRRWSLLTNQSAVLLRLQTGGGASAACVCAAATETHEGQTKDEDDDDEGRRRVCSRWLRSKTLSSVILSSTSDLQGALTHTGSAPPDVMSAARSALSRLLDHLLGQSDALSLCSQDEDSLIGRLRLGLLRVTPPQPDAKALVATLQQHFLLFSQRLHTAEVERRSLRLQVNNLKRGLRQEREETVPLQRFLGVCEELQEALSREQEAQTLLQEQSGQLHTLQLRVHTHTAEQAGTQHTLSQTAQSLSEARQELSRKERSLRILGKHLSGVQRDRKQLEDTLRRHEDELRDANRRRDCLIRNMKAAETSYKEVREMLVQSRCSLSAEPRPLPLPREHLELSGAESIMGAPEVAACQSLLSSVSQLVLSCSSRIGWLEQEVSAHRSHVTALRGELQDVCLRDNQAFVPLAEFPEAFPFADVEAAHPVPVSDSLKDPSVSLSPALSQISPAPSGCAEMKERKKAVKKNRGGRR